MRYSLIAGVVVAALAAGAVTASAAPRDGEVRRDLVNLVQQERFPAALMTVETGGRSTSYAEGVARLGQPAPPPRNGRVRAGSNTKPFVAVVVLQLVAEGKVELEAPIDRYLPGLVRGEGIDGKVITVHQLLQHTSGLPNYTEYLGLEDVDALRNRYYEPRELLDIALQHPAKFKPGTSWEYSNTNYVLAGLLAERVTGRPIAEQVTERVIDRAGLRDTYWPSVGDREIRGAHPHGYVLDNDGRVLDVTELDPSWGWAAGQLVTTPADLNRFFGALLGGKLLPATQLAQMKTTVPATLFPGAQYGLGLIKAPLTCGGEYWGHGGDIHGFETRGGVTEDGRKASVAVTALPGMAGAGTEPRAQQAVLATVDNALCD